MNSYRLLPILGLTVALVASALVPVRAADSASCTVWRSPARRTSRWPGETDE